MTEAEFQKTVIQIAQLKGWRCAHFKAARMQSGSWATPVQADGKGWPDLVLVRERVVFAELKREEAQLRPEQIVWLEKLTDAGCECYVWRPSDLADLTSILSNNMRANGHVAAAE